MFAISARNCASSAGIFWFRNVSFENGPFFEYFQLAVTGCSTPIENKTLHNLSVSIPCATCLHDLSTLESAHLVYAF